VPSSALEAFFLSGALLINARRNQRTLYVIEEGEKRGEIEKLKGREGGKEGGEREREGESAVVDESGRECF
jgi:hypothetical protein